MGNPPEETSFLASTIVRGPDFHNEIWRRKSAGYFIVAVPLILFSIEINPFGIVIFTVDIGAIVITAFYERDKKFPLWLCLVALFRSLQETQSLVKARNIGALQIRRTNADLIGTLDPVLIELNELVSKREWERFQRRFEYIIEEFEEETILSQSRLTDLYIQSLLQVHQQTREIERQRFITQTRSVKRVIHEVTTRTTIAVEKRLEDALNQSEGLIQNAYLLFSTISEYDMVSALQYELEQPSRNLIHNSPEKVTPELVSLFLKWFKDGTEKFGEIATKAAGILDEPEASQETLRVIMDSGKPELWRSITPSMAKELSNMRGEDVIDAKVSIVGTGNPELVSAIIETSDVIPPQLAQAMILSVAPYDDPIQTSIQSKFGALLFNLESNEFEDIFNGQLQSRISNVKNLALVLLKQLVARQKVSSPIERRILSILKGPLQSSSPEIRKLAADVLIQINSKKAKIILKEMAENDPDPIVRQHVTQALSEL